MTAPPINHACKRIKERYGAELTGEDLRAMCTLINLGKAHVEKKCRDGVWRVVVLFEKKAYFCIYSPEKNKILTVLPHGWGFEQRPEPTKRDYHRVRRRQRAMGA